MRIPVDKIYRAFPELDRFTDQQCKTFVNRVKQTEKFKNVNLWVAAGAIPSFMLCLIVECACGNLLLDLGARWIGRVHGPNLAIGLCGFVLCTVTAVGGLMGRDAFLRRELKHAIWRNIERIRCRQCGYSLLGQRVTNGDLIHCSECGATTSLAALGLASELDLMPPDAVESDTITG